MKDVHCTPCTSCQLHVKWLYFGLALLMTTIIGGVAFQLIAQEPKATTKSVSNKALATDTIAAPELTKITGWINSEPLELKKLRGQVVVVHFWTFGCINCVRNIPYYNRWQQDFAKEKLTIIGVHTPEFEHEAKPEALKAAIEKQQIQFPVALDPEQATWDAFQNRYWPAIYLIDKQGKIRLRWEGELEHNKAGGEQLVRQKIKELLAE